MLTEAERSAVEAQVRAACEAGKLDVATTRVVEKYGPELLGYLHAVLRNEADSDDAFAALCESVWQNLAGFEWRSSLRTWLYALARSAVGRITRSPHRRAGRAIPLSHAGVAEAAAKVRSSTAAYLRTGFRDRVAQLRATLSADDQTLLILRVGRKMAWNDIADVMADEPLDAPGRKRAAAALRKRFERVRNTLREQAKPPE